VTARCLAAVGGVRGPGLRGHRAVPRLLQRRRPRTVAGQEPADRGGSRAHEGAGSTRPCRKR